MYIICHFYTLKFKDTTQPYLFYDFCTNSIEILWYCKFVMLDQNEQGKLMIQ
jgi:hypothetical protein